MTDLESLVRETLAAHAEDAPAPAGLTEGARALRRRHRARRQVALGVAAAAATAVAIVVPLSLSSGSAPSRVAPVESPLPSPVPSIVEAGRTVAYHGILLTVPRTWGVNLTRCGTPTRDTVIRDAGVTETCLITRPPRVSSVELVGGPGQWQLVDPRTETNSHGVRLERGRVKGRSSGFGVLVPDAGVLMFVDTVRPATGDRIVDSIRRSDTDETTGCAMQEQQLYPPAWHGSAWRLGDAVIPGRPVSVAVCHYTANWLESSTIVRGRALDRLVHAANTAPTGYVHAPPSSYLPSVCTDEERGLGFVLIARYAGEAPVRVWAHIQTCGPLGISNGVTTGALTRSLVLAVVRPLRTGVGFPGTLLPGAK